MGEFANSSVNDIR